MKPEAKLEAKPEVKPEVKPEIKPEPIILPDVMDLCESADESDLDGNDTAGESTTGVCLHVEISAMRHRVSCAAV